MSSRIIRAARYCAVSFLAVLTMQLSWTGIASAEATQQLALAVGSQGLVVPVGALALGGMGIIAGIIRSCRGTKVVDPANERINP